MTLDKIAKAIAFCVLTGILSAARQAEAQTIYLTCDDTGQNKISITVDLTNKTANNLPAAINSTAIDWMYSGTRIDWFENATRLEKFSSGDTELPDSVISIVMHNHIDRITGTYSRYTVLHSINGKDTSGFGETVPCALSNLPPAKF